MLTDPAGSGSDGPPLRQEGPFPRWHSRLQAGPWAECVLARCLVLTAWRWVPSRSVQMVSDSRKFLVFMVRELSCYQFCICILFKENEAVLGSKREGLSTALRCARGAGAGALVVRYMQYLIWFSFFSLPLPA